MFVLGRLGHASLCVARPAMHFAGRAKFSPLADNFQGWPYFLANPLALSWATNSRKQNSKIAHHSRDIRVKPYIKNPVRRKCCLQKKLCLMGPICSMKRHKFWPARIRGKSFLKKLSQRPLSERLSPPSGKFSRETPNFFAFFYMGTVEH